MKKTRLCVGTSGWTYDDWSGRFYPKDVKGAERLAFYAQKFNTVEVNATFYRLPTQPMLDAWNRRLPARFHLVLKGSRLVTHLKKLDDCAEPLRAFFDRAGQLRALRVILWQLPPSLHKDVERLERFLSGLPSLSENGERHPKSFGHGTVDPQHPGASPHFRIASRHEVRHALEFRHQSWWDDEVAAALERHDAAFVAVSHPRLPDAIRPTSDFLYLRFHGLGEQLYAYDYSDRELSDWAARVAPHLRGRTLYAFFNNDYQANAPRNAATFREMLEKP
jgi:uncharacterized protein YecE (DUF72 family)